MIGGGIKKKSGSWDISHLPVFFSTNNIQINYICIKIYSYGRRKRIKKIF